MPYFITDDSEGCDGWATVKDDGEVMGCHGSKQGAIDQALAIAQAEGSTFEGERSLYDDGMDKEYGMEVTPVTPRTKGSDVEFRSFTGELRQEGDGNTFVGYAAVFNSPSEPLPFIERIAPGAFAKSLRNRKQDIRLYVNHDSNMVLASRNSRTLRLSEDERGLRVEADLPDTTAGRDIRELMATGVVDKMSFGFQVDRRGDKWSDDGMERTLTSVRLFEVSVVTGFPAYEATTAAVRSLEKLSERTGIAVDELTEALDLLAEGAELPADKASLLMDAIKQSSPEPEPEPTNLLALKAKQTELLAKKVW
jgi:uncharacterized protein